MTFSKKNDSYKSHVVFYQFVLLIRTVDSGRALKNTFLKSHNSAVRNIFLILELTGKSDVEVNP